MMRILITGGAGYIGTALTLQLMQLEEVSGVVVYDNLSRSNFNFFLGNTKFNNKVQFIQGELLDSYKLSKTLKDIDVVIHLAAKVTTPFADQNPHLFDQINNWGTAELVYAIENSNVKNLIYFSSSSVYGASDVEVDINSSPNPRTFYGISKLNGEKHVARIKDKINVNIIRCGNVYGYNRSMRFDAVINRFMFEANYKNRITINGNGEQHRSFIHIEKVADFVQHLVLNKHQDIYFNLVDRILNINEIADVLHEVYPQLEMLFVDQQLKLRQIKVKREDNIQNIIALHSQKSLLEELMEFKQYFA